MVNKPYIIVTSTDHITALYFLENKGEHCLILNIHFFSNVMEDFYIFDKIRAFPKYFT